MKKILALILALSLLLCGCGRENSAETTLTPEETAAQQQAQGKEQCKKSVHKIPPGIG